MFLVVKACDLGRMLSDPNFSNEDVPFYPSPPNSVVWKSRQVHQLIKTPATHSNLIVSVFNVFIFSILCISNMVGLNAPLQMWTSFFRVARIQYVWQYAEAVGPLSWMCHLVWPVLCFVVYFCGGFFVTVSKPAFQFRSICFVFALHSVSLCITIVISSEFLYLLWRHFTQSRIGELDAQRRGSLMT